MNTNRESFVQLMHVVLSWNERRTNFNVNKLNWRSALGQV